MNETLRLGRIAGVRIGANWSLLVTLFLIMAGLGSVQLPHDARGHPSLVYYSIAFGIALVFYACLVAHELAHSIVAKRHGLEVDGIVLWLLGGVSRLGSDAGDADGELRIAAAGPATSVALAVLFFGLSRLTGLGDPTGLLAASLGWLGWINGLLALFNLLPAFPLDGGRVLRSALWHHGGNKQRATVTAARVGEVFGYGFMGFGVVAFLTGDYLVNGVWLGLIGWFLASSARAEASRSTVSSQLAGLRARDAMTRDPFVAPSWVPLDTLMREGVYLRRLSTFPAIDENGGFIGLVTLERIRAVALDRWSATPCGWIALPAAQCITCSEDEDLSSVAARMSSSADGRAIVLDERNVVGVITPGDLRRTAAHAPISSAVSKV